MNELDPTQTEAVRRALAAARHDGPIPAEVAARLDATLADLVAEASMPAVAAAMAAPSEATTAKVIPFRRRRLPVLLAAAAAVVAVAVGAPQLMDQSAEPAGLAARDDAASATSESAEAGDRSVPGPASIPELNSTLDSVGVTELRDATLAQDVGRLVIERHRSAQQKSVEGYDSQGGSANYLDDPVDGATPDANKSDTPLSAAGTGPWVAAAARGCGPAQPPAGSQVFHARFRGHSAVVVALPRAADGTPVLVYDCRIAPRVPTRLFTVRLAD
jgi:hypothetical protein